MMYDGRTESREIALQCRMAAKFRFKYYDSDVNFYEELCKIYSHSVNGYKDNQVLMLIIFLQPIPTIMATTVEQSKLNKWSRTNCRNGDDDVKYCVLYSIQFHTGRLNYTSGK